MIYLFYFILMVNILFLIISFLNFIFNKIYLKKLKNNRSNISALVSVLIPARNEEKNINNLLNDLIKQDYENLEIIVFNDCSTDKTKDIVEKFTQIDKRIKLIDSQTLPEGWLGKNYACYNLAKSAKGDYFLFLDADVRIENNLISDSIVFIEKEKISFLSIFPVQKMFTLSEKIFIPIIYNILLSLLPLYLVLKSKYSSLSAAIGQFMLFKRDIYLKYNPHYIFKTSRAEDVEIARYLKKHNEKICCLVADERLSCRMYQDFNQIINGFSRFLNVIFFNSYLFAFIFGVIEFLSLVFIVYFKSLILFLLVFLRIYIVSITSKQNIFLNLTFLPMRQIFFLFIILISYIFNKKRKIIWRDRVI